MTPSETVLFIRYVRACCPQQAIDEYTADAWHDVLACEPWLHSPTPAPPSCNLRFAYADPPYLGMCGKLYGHRHDEPWGCWNDLSTHRPLISLLTEQYPDGWVMSASEPSIRDILPLTSPGTRICPWNKSFCAFKKGVRPAHAWEPVFLWGGRNKGRACAAEGWRADHAKGLPHRADHAAGRADWRQAAAVLPLGARPARLHRRRHPR